MKKLTVGQLKKALENVPDDLEVELSSDTGVDEGLDEGERVIINGAQRFNYKTIHGAQVDYFAIFADYVDELEEEE